MGTSYRPVRVPMVTLSTSESNNNVQLSLRTGPLSLAGRCCDIVLHHTKGCVCVCVCTGVNTRHQDALWEECNPGEVVGIFGRSDGVPALMMLSVWHLPRHPVVAIFPDGRGLFGSGVIWRAQVHPANSLALPHNLLDLKVLPTSWGLKPEHTFRGLVESMSPWVRPVLEAEVGLAQFLAGGYIVVPDQCELITSQGTVTDMRRSLSN